MPKEKYIDTFTFTVVRTARVKKEYGMMGYKIRLYIKGLDEFALHYDIKDTPDIILALIDFRRPHNPNELDYSFPTNAKYKEKIQKYSHPFSYPTEMVTEEGLIELFDLVADREAYDFIKKETHFDYYRDFYTQVSGNYFDTVEELNNWTQYARRIDPIYYDEPAGELRPKSRWLSIYKRKAPSTPINNKPQTNRAYENPDYPQWRSKVLTRDKVCQCCGHDDKLEVHHLFGYKENPSLQTNTGNGVTLCKFCHKKYHSIYGLKDINPVDFMEFIKQFGVSK